MSGLWPDTVPCSRKMKKILVLLVLFALFCSNAVFAAENLWEWSPYRICIQIDMSQDALIKLGFDDREQINSFIASHLPQVAENWVGGLWNITVRDGSFPNTLFQANMLADSVHLDNPALKDIIGSEFDKIVYLFLDGSQTGIAVIHAKELDVRTLYVAGHSSVDVRHQSFLIDSVFDAIWGSFAPVASIDQVHGSRVILRLLGGELMNLKRHDVGFEPSVSPDDVFITYSRAFDKTGKLIAVTPIPWTALVVQKCEGSSVECELESGIRFSLTSRKRGRSEQIAILPRLQAHPTRLVLHSRILPQTDDSIESTREKRIKFLTNYQISEKRSEKYEILGTTDVFGSIVIPYLEGEPIRTLYIRQGDVLVAKLPLVQGFKPEIPVAIPDDEIRIAAEGRLIGIQEEVIDLVARKEILTTRIDKLSQQPASQALDTARREMDRLKNQQYYIALLAAEKLRYRSPDPLVQRRIDIMFENTRKIITEFMR